MRWRQSVVRCNKISCDMTVHIYYQVFEAMFYILRGDRPRTTKDAVQVFRGAVQELSGKHRRAGEYLMEHWPELKGAIERSR